MPDLAKIASDLTTSLSNLSEARMQTRALARGHYENFLVASFLLPKYLRQPFFDVYAFCRIADDLADESPSPEDASVRLIELRGYLRCSWEGVPTSNLFLALHHTAKKFKLDQQPFEDLLDAFDQDQVKFRYQTMDELIEYCSKSADPVGRIVLQLAGCLSRETETLSNQICTGLQLANHLQDMARDYQLGRVYFPASDWSRFGVTESMLQETIDSGTPTPQPIRELVAHHCEISQGYLERGLPLAKIVPRWLAADIRLFAHGGLKTIEAIRAIEFDVLAVRPTVSKWEQTKLILRAIFGRL